MKFLHLGNWNSTNIGNGALIYGVERLLREDLPGPIEFVPEAWDDYTFKRKRFDESFVARVNEHDALLVNGAVTFNAFRRQMKETGMRVNLPLPLWDQITKPVVFYGISYMCWPFQDYPNADAARKWLQYAVASEHIYLAVRNDGTKKFFADRFGVDSDRIHELPDPGMFVPAEENDYPELSLTKKNILISFNGEDSPYRFATPFSKFFFKYGQKFIDAARFHRGVTRLGFHQAERQRIVQEVVRAVEYIARMRDDVQFVLVPHYLDDYGMVQEFIERIQERIAHQLVVSTGLVKVQHASWFYGRYKKADLALSMRIHSMSPSIGLNTPVIPLTSQGRMRRFLTNMDIADIAVDISSPSFGIELGEKAVALLADPAPFKKRTAEAVERMRALARERNAEIWEFLNKK